MKDVNKVILLGRLGADPVQRETKSGLAVVHFPLATSHWRREDLDEEGDRKNEATVWHRVVVWGKQAETCAQFLKKGRAIYLEGTVRTRKYDGKDGQSRVAFEVHAENVSFLGKPQGQLESGQSQDRDEPVSEVAAV